MTAMIYLDNAATTLIKPEAVYRRSNEVLRYFSANAGRGGHAASLKAGELLFDARQRAAEFFGAPNERCVFTFGCTDALNLVLRGLFAPGDHVLTTAYEHNAVLRPLAWLKKTEGLDYTVLFPHADGVIPLDDFVSALRESTRAVIVNPVSNVTGHVQDLTAIGAFCKENGLLLIADGAQAAGHLPLSMHTIDYLCCAGHK
ncbi:MAG: aminotransferase class V-fold PLP-dependent enzyme, partial [Clostridia bacterium]|nr:aminotransferase class V-fold PLP-dependent enzyme [Clostridia bacterium]